MPEDAIQHPNASEPATLNDMKELLKTLVPMADTIKSHQEALALLLERIEKAENKIRELEAWSPHHD